jgi:hypothetical protein
MAADDVAIVLDGVQDAVSRLTETIEQSQATISAFQGAILEEKNNVHIVGHLQAAGRHHSSDIISLHSMSSEEVEVTNNVVMHAQGSSRKLPMSSRSILQQSSSDQAVGWRSQLDAHNQPSMAVDATYRRATGSTISLTSSSSDIELNGHIKPNINEMSSESSSNCSVSPQSTDEEEDCDSMVPSRGLTNTSDEEE